ncbi:sialate O-acetylesterase [Herbiconiux daphne]|uniref:Sialate O-acetylesterase n=1 Tax=Herbiconiux daphne TaxID=2970914 RepID=A0ABT2GWP1_9MICO|nr:sialate O-acetylesterase [Herbiconiux daphne]MCS5732384.1 sialate O-acetylesterase [Herbiconiux daphne]
MTTLEHIPTSGQSLSTATNGTPGYSLLTEAANALLVDAIAGTLSPLQLASTAAPQRPDLSMGYRVAQHAPSQRFGFSTHGQGGQSIAQLSKGGSSGRYEAAIACIAAARAVEVGAGGTFKVGPLHWIQGEADQVGGTSISTYLARLATLQSDYTADIAAISGQAGQLPLIMSQTATWAYYGSEARIGLAQLQAARTMPNVYLVGGQYQFPYSDGLHLNRVGYYKLGELHARAHNAIRDGADWLPFAPRQIVVGAGSVVVRFNVPTGSLAFDTTVVAAQPNMGFSLSGTAAAITAVTITGVDEVTLTTSQPVVEPGASVSYGITSGTGPGLGNLRDSETMTSVYDGGPLANWALHFNDDLFAPAVAQTIWVASDMYRFMESGGLQRLTLAP